LLITLMKYNIMVNNYYIQKFEQKWKNQTRFM